MNKIALSLKEISLLLSVFLMFSLTACGNGNKEYYKDGSLKSIGETSQSKGKQGHWQFFYNNGNLMSEGEYVEDKPNGKWTYWNIENKIVAEKNFRNGIEVSETEKEAAPKVTEKHSAQPEPKLEQTPEAEPKSEQAAEHKAVIEPETAVTQEIKTTEPYVENRSGFAATMDEWKTMKKRKKEMPKAEAHGETSTEEADTRTAETLIEPAPEPTPVAEQKAEIYEPVQTSPVQEVEAQPIAEITEPAEREVEPAKEQAPAQKKKPAASGKKFWQN